jgi:hypothetical protein
MQNPEAEECTNQNRGVLFTVKQNGLNEYDTSSVAAVFKGKLNLLV